MQCPRDVFFLLAGQKEKLLLNSEVFDCDDGDERDWVCEKLYDEATKKAQVQDVNVPGLNDPNFASKTRKVKVAGKHFNSNRPNFKAPKGTLVKPDGSYKFDIVLMGNVPVTTAWEVYYRD